MANPRMTMLRVLSRRLSCLSIICYLSETADCKGDVGRAASLLQYNPDAILILSMDAISGSTWLWVGFSLFILTMLSLDLGLFNRKAHTIRYREAWIWSAVWVTLPDIELCELCD